MLRRVKLRQTTLMNRDYQANGRVEIAGGIASGKTTLAGVLSRDGLTPVYERFQDSPFWEAFYADPGAHGFETELSFLLLHYHQMKLAEAPAVCDFSLTLDEGYADVSLQSTQHEAFERIAQEVRMILGPPSLVVHVTCPPEVELERIRRRGRSQESSIEIAFLESLNRAVSARVRTLPPDRVVTIDSSNIDFREEAGAEVVLRAVRSHRRS